MLGITIENTTYSFTSLASAKELGALGIPDDSTDFWRNLIMAARELVAYFDAINPSI